MQLTERHREYWSKNLRITGILLAIWFFVTFVIGFFARDLNFTFFGWPFSFWVGAQGALIVYVLIIGFYLVLGCFMETISMMILTTPFIAPIVFALGWDPIWWGIVLTVMIEVALITPPVGLNLYVVQGMRDRGPVSDVIWGALPFVIAMLGLVALLMTFPELALWLPKLVMG